MLLIVLFVVKMFRDAMTLVIILRGIMAAEEYEVELMKQKEDGIACNLALPNRSLSRLRNIATEDFLSREKDRYYLKKKILKPFISIFPWFIIKYSVKTRKFREHCDLLNILDFRNALEYFCCVFDDTRISHILSCFRELYSFSIAHPLIAVIKAHKILVGPPPLLDNIVPAGGDESKIDLVISNHGDLKNDFIVDSITGLPQDGEFL